MYRKWMIEGICLLFVLLFVYTAVSKFLDFENFRAVIGQSPVVTKFADVLAVGVPIAELVISLLLLLPKYRLLGLYASFFIMVLFTAYIVMLVTLSDKIPCSCGGVIQRMSWDQHIYFNLVFVGLALVGMVLKTKDNQYSNKEKTIPMVKA